VLLVYCQGIEPLPYPRDYTAFGVDQGSLHKARNSTNTTVSEIDRYLDILVWRTQLIEVWVTHKMGDNLYKESKAKEKRKKESKSVVYRLPYITFTGHVVRLRVTGRVTTTC
jgi:hypothetical protein